MLKGMGLSPSDCKAKKKCFHHYFYKSRAVLGMRLGNRHRDWPIQQDTCFFPGMKLFANLFWTVPSYRHCLCPLRHLLLSREPSLMPPNLDYVSHHASPAISYLPILPNSMASIPTHTAGPFEEWPCLALHWILVLPTKGTHLQMLNKYLVNEWVSPY